MGGVAVDIEGAAGFFAPVGAASAVGGAGFFGVVAVLSDDVFFAELGFAAALAVVSPFLVDLDFAVSDAGFLLPLRAFVAVRSCLGGDFLRLPDDVAAARLDADARDSSRLVRVFAADFRLRDSRMVTVAFSLRRDDLWAAAGPVPAQRLIAVARIIRRESKRRRII